MSARCTGEPVSWLRLEQLRLGELAEGERAAVTGHLAACAACAACAAVIEADEARDLPSLEVRPQARESPKRPWRTRRWWAGAGTLAAAAAMLLAVGRAWRTPALPGPSGHPGETLASPGLTSIKGDGMAFTLVRDDGERLVEAQGVFRESDRFKALVTCPPSMNASFDLVVVDPGGASFPLEPARALACGNEVPLPGAFRLSGAGRQTVCVVWRDEGEVDRAALSLAGVVADAHALCKELRPVEGD